MYSFILSVFIDIYCMYQALHYVLRTTQWTKRQSPCPHEFSNLMGKTDNKNNAQKSTKITAMVNAVCLFMQKAQQCNKGNSPSGGQFFLPQNAPSSMDSIPLLIPTPQHPLDPAVAHTDLTFLESVLAANVFKTQKQHF